MMKRNKLSITITLIVIMLIFSLATISGICGCSLISSKENINADKSLEQSVDMKAPTIELEIYEGPKYSSTECFCYYIIKADITGNPAPNIEFSRDDSNGTLGPKKVQININVPSETYNLTATAKNEKGSDTTSINLNWGCSFGGAEFKIIAPFSEAILEIDQDGNALYKAGFRENGEYSNTKCKKLSNDDISYLIKSVQESNFFLLEESYPYIRDISREDGSDYTIQITIGNKTKKVNCYQFECPKRFTILMRAIGEIWGEEIMEVGV